MISYTEIASYFEKAFDGKYPSPSSFKGAVMVMKNKPDLCERLSAFNETMWLIIEEYLNSGAKPTNEEAFIHAVALLEAKEDKPDA